MARRKNRRAGRSRIKKRIAYVPIIRGRGAYHLSKVPNPRFLENTGYGSNGHPYVVAESMPLIPGKHQPTKRIGRLDKYKIVAPITSLAAAGIGALAGMRGLRMPVRSILPANTKKVLDVIAKAKTAIDKAQAAVVNRAVNTILPATKKFATKVVATVKNGTAHNKFLNKLKKVQLPTAAQIGGKVYDKYREAKLGVGRFLNRNVIDASGFDTAVSDYTPVPLYSSPLYGPPATSVENMSDIYAWHKAQNLPVYEGRNFFENLRNPQHFVPQSVPQSGFGSVGPIFRNMDVPPMTLRKAKHLSDMVERSHEVKRRVASYATRTEQRLGIPVYQSAVPELYTKDQIHGIPTYFGNPATNFQMYKDRTGKTVESFYR